MDYSQEMSNAITIPKDPRLIEEMEDKDFLDLLSFVKATNPQNRGAMSLDIQYYLNHNEEEKKQIRLILAPGLMSPDSKIGVYVREVNDYLKFQGWLNEIINDYHNTDIANNPQVHDWDRRGKSYRLNEINDGLNNVSMRIRIAINPEDFNLPASQTKEERLKLENKMIEIFKSIPEGQYFSLTPGSEFLITDEKYEEFRENHYMFRPMTEDPHLMVSDLASDWPYGRGMFIKEIPDTDFKLIVWVGEEDSLRVMCMGYGNDLGVAFDSLREFRELLEKNGLSPANNSIIGTPTSCPSNIGTSMRMSILLDPKEALGKTLTKEQINLVAKALGLQVRGLHGETTSTDAEVYDISPSARYGLTEIEMLDGFYESLKKLIQGLNS